MSARKRKQSQDLQPVFDSIQDVLITIKPKVAEGDLNGSSARSILEDLQKVATLAESFTHQRRRTNKDWLPLADALDREGVHLWNVSAQLRDVADDGIRAVFAALRLAGFRLIEAGLEQHPTPETLIHVLQIASKAGASLSEIGRTDVAASVLACAAKYEEDLKNVEITQGGQLEQAKARAVVLYHSSRMEAACREGNDGVAEFMLQKIIENEHRLSLLQPRDRMALSAKLLEIGKRFLKSSRAGNAVTEPSQAQVSVKWLQKALSVIELSSGAESPGLAELKRSILRSLTRAYFLASTDNSDNLDCAEASLNELISSIDVSIDRDGSEYQQLQWMRIAILKRRKAADPHLLEAFMSIIDHLGLVSESTVTDILQELRTLSQHHVMVTAVHQHALKKALDAPDNVGLPHVDRLLLSLVVHCSRDENHARAMQDIATAFSCLSEAEYTLPKVPSTACLTLLWQFGDRHFNAKHWVEAADWYLAGTHAIFTAILHASEAKCFRKAALCYIQQRDYSKASAILRHCPAREAATYYVIMLTAVHQGLESEAVRAVQSMVKASDFDRKMLLLATQLANESDMKTLLLSVLEELLRTLSSKESPDFDAETMTLLRCIIRLVVKLIGEPAANRAVLIPTLIRHFRTANDFVGGLRDKNKATMSSKDISWLWRTAYNCAVQGCTDWENADEAASDLFDVSRMLLETYCASVLTDVEADLYVHLANASFAATAGRMFSARRKASSGSALQDVPLVSISDDIKSCKIRIQQVIDSNQFPSVEDADRARSFIHILRVFEAEVLCMRQEWKLLLRTVEEATRSDELAVNTFEAIADIVWAEKECPVDVLFAALEAILHASLDRTSLSITKFSRWLRAMCTILLARSSPADRTKAIGYVEQAVAVLEEHGEAVEGDDVYPIDERQWLLGTAYNTGIECLHASMVDEAKRWFESSTVICRFVPDGKTRAEKISETYTQLLSRYAPGGANTTDS